MRVAFGPLSDNSPLDPIPVGAAGGILVLAAIALPVTVASISKTVATWVIAVCVVAGVAGLALIIKSVQRQKTVPGRAQVHKRQDGSRQPRSAIDVVKSILSKSPVDIPEHSEVLIKDSSLTDSALTIRDASKPRDASESEDAPEPKRESDGT